MPRPLSEAALKQLFYEARSMQRFKSRGVADGTLRRLYDLLRLGPTGFNAQPARYLFIRSPQAKEKLAPALSSSNRAKSLAAAVNVIVAWDSRFYEHLPVQFPAYDASGFFESSPVRIEPAATTNATLQAAYLLLAARALGLDVCPMSGFKTELVNQVFFPDGRFRALLLVNLGYGDRTGLAPRGPRLPFEQVARIL
jgi:3-hydroxypropanoate dehydrogenase